jgi:short-subunit dehydrogenase
VSRQGKRGDGGFVQAAKLGLAMTDGVRPLALVTGASRGIGADLARELAADGYDLVLASRSEGDMQRLAAELAAHGADATVIAADLSRPGAAARLIAEIDAKGRAIDVLVNNAGLGAIGRFDRSEPKRIEEMLQVNIVALTELTRLVLPAMQARRRGRILLVASTAGYQPGPRMAVYFASKAYVLNFGEALAWEVRGSGVTVTTLCPGATATDFFRVAGAGNGRAVGPMMSSAAVAKLGWRGCKAGRRVVITGAMNRVLAFGGRLAPRALLLPAVDLLNARR